MGLWTAAALVMVEMVTMSQVPGYEKSRPWVHRVAFGSRQRCYLGTSRAEQPASGRLAHQDVRHPGLRGGGRGAKADGDGAKWFCRTATQSGIKGVARWPAQRIGEDRVQTPF